MKSVGRLFLCFSVAQVTVSAVDFTHWQAPGPNDVRSPCPGLNSLANHGILPRSGKGMTLPILLQGLSAGMNVGDDFTTAIGTAGLLSSPDPLGGSFDLNDLDEHNFPIEHDASLSRQDAYFGNDYSFNQTTFNQVLSYYAGMNTTSIPVASHAKYSRVQTESQRDPTFTYGPREFLLSYGETALYLSVMGDPTTGIAPVDYVEIFFEQERLPYTEGWRPPAQQTTLNSLGAMILQLYANSPEPLPEGLEVITVGGYKDALEGIDPVTGILANATCALAGSC